MYFACCDILPLCFLYYIRLVFTLWQYIQILHNLLCASVCHSRRLLAHLQPETRPMQTRDQEGLWQFNTDKKLLGWDPVWKLLFLPHLGLDSLWPRMTLNSRIGLHLFLHVFVCSYSCTNSLGQESNSGTACGYRLLTFYLGNIKLFSEIITMWVGASSAEI